MKPTDSESADQNGYEAFCVSGRGWNPCDARLLIHSRGAPDPSAATITSRRPSGDTANRDSAFRASTPPASCMPAGNTTEEMIAGASADRRHSGHRPDHEDGGDHDRGGRHPHQAA